MRLTQKRSEALRQLCTACHGSWARATRARTTVLQLVKYGHNVQNYRYRMGVMRLVEGGYINAPGVVPKDRIVPDVNEPSHAVFDWYFPEDVVMDGVRQYLKDRAT